MSAEIVVIYLKQLPISRKQHHIETQSIYHVDSTGMKHLSVLRGLCAKMSKVQN